MKKAVDLMNNFCYVLTQMERNGIQIDMDELLRLEKEFEEELAGLSITLEKLVREAVGDTPFSLNSGEDKSWIVFSRVLESITSSSSNSFSSLSNSLMSIRIPLSSICIKT